MQFFSPTAPTGAALIQSAFERCYPGARGTFRRERITYRFLPGPVGLPNESTLVFWRDVPGYRYRLGVRASGEVLSAGGLVLSPEELTQLLCELGQRWHKSAQRAEATMQRVLLEMAMQTCFVLMVVLGGFALLGAFQDASTEDLELGGLAAVFCITGFICRNQLART